MSLGFGVWGALGFRVYGCGYFALGLKGWGISGFEGFGSRESENARTDREGGREREKP